MSIILIKIYLINNNLILNDLTIIAFLIVESLYFTLISYYTFSLNFKIISKISMINIFLTLVIILTYYLSFSYFEFISIYYLLFILLLVLFRPSNFLKT